MDRNSIHFRVRFLCHLRNQQIYSSWEMASGISVFGILGSTTETCDILAFEDFHYFLRGNGLRILRACMLCSNTDGSVVTVGVKCLRHSKRHKLPSRGNVGSSGHTLLSMYRVRHGNYSDFRGFHADALFP